MITVIGRVEIDAVPARGEAMVRHDADGTRLLWEVEGLRLARALVLHANVSQLAEVTRLLAGAVVYVAHEHAEARLEGRDCGFLGRVEEGVGHVVDDLGTRQWDRGAGVLGGGRVPCLPVCLPFLAGRAEGPS